jgi:hypothetical protein
MKPASKFALIAVTAALLLWLVQPAPPPVRLSAFARRLPTAPAHASAAAQTATAPASPAIASAIGLPAPAQPRSAAAAFADWTERFLAGDPTASVPQGEALAWQRRAMLRELISTNPAQALAEAAPFRWRQALPARITRHFEQRVDGRGDLLVAVGTDFERRKSSMYREAEIGGEWFQVFVQGRRETQVSQSAIPLHGIAIDERLALLNDPLRPLEPAETAALAQQRGQSVPETCAVCATPASALPEAVSAEGGGETLRFCCAGHAALANAHWIMLEDGGSGVGPRFISAADSRWTHGPKAVLYMRLNFPDDLTEPISETGAYAVMDAVNDFYEENSYHATALTTTVTPLVTVPQSKAWYATSGPGALLRDAREAARRAGFDTRNYDLDIACHTSVPGFDWGGLGAVHGKGTWLQSAGVGVTAHELGHNYGLGHANWWNTITNGSVIGPGENVEYGNIFDTMGSGGSHFNALFKSLLGWLPDPVIHEAGQSGVYRCFAFDAPVRVPMRSYAARVPRDALRDYWLELRERFPGNPWITHGVLLNHSPSPAGGGGSKLLDTTPGTPTTSSSREDAALVIGRTFSDAAANVHFTPLARGQAGTSVWMEVEINLGTPASNGPPTFRLEIEQTNSAPGSYVHFRAVATDPEGDALAYAWSFDDFTFSTNNLPWTFQRWSAPGEYLVRCVVSDRRGGVASANAVVNVGNAPALQVSGRVVDLDGLPLEGVRVDNAGSDFDSYRGGYTDSEGRFVIVRPTADLTLYAANYGWVFTNAGWSNPLTLTSSLPDVDFIGVPLPTVRIAASTNALAENDPTVSTIRFTRTGDLTNELLAVVYLSGSASLSNDFRFDPEQTSGFNTITFPAGVAEVEFAFHALNDNAIEAAETCALTLIEDHAYVVAPRSEAVLTILDNDSPARPAVSVTTGTPSVSESGMDRGQFLFSRSGTTEAELTVTYAISGNATAGADYPTLAGVLVIPAGNRSASVYCQPTDDKNVEADETVIVAVTSQPAYTVSGSAATITVLDDDLLTVTITPTGGAAEPDAAGHFTVKREGDLSANLLVKFTTSGTATPDLDYQALSGSITIPAGAASEDIVVTPKDDLLVEGDESVGITVVTNAAYSVGTPGSAMLSIRDNEKVTVTVSAPDAEASEPGAETGLFTIARGTVVNGNLTVNLAFSGVALNGVDYIPLETTVVIPNGASSLSLEVIPFDDLHLEYDEAVLLTLLPGTNYNVGNPATERVVIVDDDLSSVPAAGFSFTTSSVEERLSPGVSVTLSWTSTAPATVEFRVIGGTAATNDYRPAAGVLEFAPGERAKSIPVQITDNSLAQTDRTIRLVLFNPSGATLDGYKFHTYTILDDDTAAVSVTATVASTGETGGPPGNFRLTRTGATNASLLVNFQLTGTASAPGDYAPLGKSVVIPAGAAFVDLPVTPVNDGTVEFSETVVLTLISAPTGRLVTPNIATVTISDDDPESRPLVTMSSAASPFSAEGGGQGGFTFTRTGPTTEPLALDLAITGSAANGVDYLRLDNVVTIPAGQATLTVPISAVDDALVEGDETVFVALTTRDTYRVAQPGQALVVMLDNDQSVRVNASDFTAAEPGTKDLGEFTFTRFGTTNGDVRVLFTLSGAASNGLDYVAPGSSFIIPAGRLSAVLPVVPLDDLLVEGPETVTLTVQPNAAYTLGAPTVAAVLIDDDEPMVTITAPVPTVMEGSRDPGVFRITRRGDPKYDFTLALAVGGTAAFGVDYPPFLTNILFTCGMMTIDLQVFPTNELVIEGLETVTARLLPRPAYTILTPSNAVVTILDAGTNLAPSVTITSPIVAKVFLPGTNVSILLEASVTDDDANTPPTLLWSQVSGPTNFALGPTNTLNTTASFAGVGVYRLRLTADDGVLTNYAEVEAVVGAVKLLATNLLHWPLDDGAGVIARDASGTGRDGALVGAASWETNGILGGSIRLHGSGERVRETAGSNFLEGRTAFSLSLWVKPATANTEQGIFTAADAGGPPTLTLATRTHATCGAATNVIEATIPTSEGLARYVTRSSASTNGWQHLMLTWSNGLAPRLFINGQLDRPLEQMRAFAGALTNCPQFIVGQGPAEVAASWDGWVDDVRLFPRALTAGEIGALAGLPPDNYGALVDAGPDVTLQLITPATLAGTVSDDGQPVPPGTLVITWVLASGPVPVTLTNASALTNTIQFTQAGEYVFWLIADDGQVQVYDEVRLTVIEPTRVDVFAFDPLAAELGPDPGEFALLRFGDLDVELAVFLHFGGIANNGVDYVLLTNVLVFPPSVDSLKIPVTPFLDHRTEGEETVILTVVSNLAYSSGSREATVTVQDSPYGQWTVAHFTLEELTDPSLSGESADFDRDSFVNFVEYAVNRDPKNAATNSPVATALETNALTGEFHLTFTYTRRLAPTDTVYAAAVSSELVIWQTDALAVEELSATDDGNNLTETVKARVVTPLAGHSPQFVTVRVWLQSTGP